VFSQSNELEVEMVVVLRFLVVLLLPSATTLIAAGAADSSEYSCNRTTGSFTPGGAFAASLDTLVAALVANASSSSSLFATAAVGAGPDAAYGLALCRGDVTDPSVCSACLGDAFRRLRELCARGRDATLYSDACTARYSGEDFLARPGDNSPVINGLDANASAYYPGWDARNATSRSFFLSLGATLFGELAMYGAYNSSAARRFASAVMYINPQLPTVYGLAQCTPDLAPAQCWRCFQGLGDQMGQWFDGREGGRILGVRCSFRYEAYKFFAGTPDVQIGLQGSPSTAQRKGNKSRTSFCVFRFRQGNNYTVGNLCDIITVCNFLLNDVGSNKRKVVIVAVVVPITVLFCAMVAGLLLVTQRKRAGKKTMI